MSIDFEVNGRDYTIKQSKCKWTGLWDVSIISRGSLVYHATWDKKVSEEELKKWGVDIIKNFIPWLLKEE